LAAHLEEFLDGLPEMSNCYCLPGKAGGTPGILGHYPLLTLSLANKYYLLTTHLKVLELRLYQPSESMQGEILLISVFLEVEDVP
jgi:hypothetical protein